MNRFEVLGANATAPTEVGAASSYLVAAGERSDDGYVLFDAGPGSMQTFCRTHSLSELRGIVITHMHADHCLDLMAYAYRWTFPDRLPRIPLYVPETGMVQVEAFDSLFGIDTLPGMDRPIERAWECIELPDDGSPREIGDITVQAFPAHHAIHSNALRVATPDGVIAFSSDTCRCHGVEQAARRADLFVCECTYLEGDQQQMSRHGHLNAAQAARLTETARASHLLLTHFGTPGMEVQALARAKAEAPQLRIDVAEPGWAW